MTGPTDSPDSNTGDFYVRFWGVRGSIAVGSPEVMRYGGNTASIEVVCGSHRLLFDCGTGIRALGLRMAKEGKADADIFLTHTHFDHVCGIPFFVPFFIPGNKFQVYAGHLGESEGGIRGLLKKMMVSPLFPVPMEIFCADIAFHDFQQGEVINPRPGIAVRTGPLSHPDRATGYRVEYGGKSICYLTDTEHPAEGMDPYILDLIQGADIVIYDSMYTEEQYKTRKGWGHSTWEAGADLCDAAAVKTFVIFHHDPEHDDAAMDKIAADAEARRPGTVVAREGLVLRP